MYKRLLTVLVRVLAFSLSSFAASKSKKQSNFGAPDKAYLQKIMAGWSAGNPADMAQYYDKGDYTFFDIAPLKYANWAEYEKGVTDLMKNYKSVKLTVNDDAQIHTDGPYVVDRDRKGRCGHDRWQARDGYAALDVSLRKAGRQVDDCARAYFGADAVNIIELLSLSGCHPEERSREGPNVLRAE